MSVPGALLAIALVLATPLRSLAQSSSNPVVSVPRVMTLSGVFQPADGQPLRPVETVRLAVYAEATGGPPLWEEIQAITLDPQGRYTVILGITRPDGIPAEVLDAGAEWLGLQFDRPLEHEGTRTRLTSVPYALRAANADTLGGHPASAYLLAPTAAGGNGSVSSTKTGDALAASTPDEPVTANLVLPGSTNFLAKYVNSVDVGNSGVYESAGRVGIGTTSPADQLHVQFNNTNGALTGLAVQNLGNTATSYSGMLFYDQNGALGQFQGFNNATHEYRINNIAQTGGVFNGTINFMIGSTSRFLVASSGNIGIGTTSPSALLEVSNAVNGAPSNMWVTSFTNAIGPYFMARRARGSAAAPAAVQNGDQLAAFAGKGYGATGFSNVIPGTGGMGVYASENWSDTAQGTLLNFTTTPLGTSVPVTRMTITAAGNVGVGTTGPTSGLEVSNATTTAATGNVTATSFNAVTAGSLFIGRKARGTSAAPTAAVGGDVLAAFLGAGFGTTTFSGTRGGMFVRAAETWTDSAQGSSLAFNTTALGTNTPSTKMVVNPAGDVGIGTSNPVGALHVARDARNGAIVVDTADSNDTSWVMARRSRGTLVAPTAVQLGDDLGLIGMTGYGATGFGDVNVILGGFAGENWTDTAQGAGAYLATTPNGTTAPQAVLAVLPDGNVGLGVFNDIPTIADKLQVFGDIRVGTSGTNGCLRNFAGTGIAGTCSSDRRFKRDITPFATMLGKVAALQPVHYRWRAAEFPAQQFTDAPAAGLIAQDVEQVLPELVVTNDDGYKAVDYSQLPLLTIQAVKELKEENDALKSRLAEVERLLEQLRSRLN